MSMVRIRLTDEDGRVLREQVCTESVAVRRTANWIETYCGGSIRFESLATDQIELEVDRLEAEKIALVAELRIAKDEVQAADKAVLLPNETMKEDLIRQAAENVAGHRGVVLNTNFARANGIRSGDSIVVESATGSTRGVAELRQGIRPDTVLMIGQFDHWATPIAKDMNLPSLNSVSAMSLSLMDNTGSSADLVRVKVYKDPGRTR